MIPSGLPPEVPAEDVRIWCSVEAASRYGLPPDLVYAVSRAKGGRPGLASQNSNGTFDLGWMQFNTSYLRSLSLYGIRPSDVQANTCYPFHLADWRIRRHLEESGDAGIFERAAFYHSRTPKFNEIYRGRLLSAARRFDWAKARRFWAMMQNDIVRPAGGSGRIFEIKSPAAPASPAWIAAK